MYCPRCGSAVVITTYQGAPVVVCNQGFSICWVADIDRTKLEEYINNAISRAPQELINDNERLVDI